MAKRPTKDKQAVLEGELVLPSTAQDEDEQVVLQAGKSVMGFLQSVSGFFVQARTLEQRALSTREAFRSMKPPATMEEDELLQRSIRVANEDKREIEEHWEITKVITNFRNRMTARRAKATDALEEAAKIGNTLHNAYVAAERRRVEEENRRRQEEADRLAREERQRELDRIEREAQEREAASPQLSGREQVYVEQVVLGRPPQRAAQAAGFPDPVKAAERLGKSAKIAEAIRLAQEAAALRRTATARAQRPIDPVPVRTEVAQITRAPGASERTYHYGDVVDAQALIAAILAGNPGIPTDVLMINEAKVNAYAKDLQERIGRWPGVRYRKETKVV